MTTPPDFGGREIEEGLLEDLGGPPTEHEVDHQDDARLDDNELHAQGVVCGHCGKGITAGQDVRRRLDGTWVHEECPVI